MNNLAYTTLDSVLYDLSITMDEHEFNPAKMKEWATKAFRKMGVPNKYDTKVSLLEVVEHKVMLPSDLKHILQIAYTESPDTSSALEEIRESMNIADEDDNPAIKYLQGDGLAERALTALTTTASTIWKPMRLATNSFIKTIPEQYTIYDRTLGEKPLELWGGSCPGCNHEYTVDSSMCLTTTLQNGLIYISYLSYAEDINGNTLIPDDEDLKEAILHYCLYRYWLMKATTKEQGSIREREWHLTRFETLKAKVNGKLNMPSIDQLENIKDMRDRLVPRVNQYSNFFDKLNKKEYTTFNNFKTWDR